MFTEGVQVLEDGVKEVAGTHILDQLKEKVSSELGEEGDVGLVDVINGKDAINPAFGTEGGLGSIDLGPVSVRVFEDAALMVVF